MHGELAIVGSPNPHAVKSRGARVVTVEGGSLGQDSFRLP